MPEDNPKCPSCESRNVAAIAYGFPGPEMIEEAQRDDIVLGGCCFGENDPEWHCNKCEHQW